MSLPQRITVRVPATTANLGPGFDCLALALDLWNRVTFRLDESAPAGSVQGCIHGRGSSYLPLDSRNLTARAFLRLFEHAGVPAPSASIECTNRLPLGSGLGSSASAVLAGLLGANACLPQPYPKETLLTLAAEMEGHPDNAAAALWGGLVIVTSARAGGHIVRKVPSPRLQVALAVPSYHLPTQQARAALPKSVSLADAVFNLGRTALVVEAVRRGDLSLLAEALDDRLHQPYRLPLIPGAAQALQAAAEAGAAAAGLSGAGPSLIAFCAGDAQAVSQAMCAALRQAGLECEAFVLRTTSQAASVRVQA